MVQSIPKEIQRPSIDPISIGPRGIGNTASTPASNEIVDLFQYVTSMVGKTKQPAKTVVRGMILCPLFDDPNKRPAPPPNNIPGNSLNAAPARISRKESLSYPTTGFRNFLDPKVKLINAPSSISASPTLNLGLVVKPHLESHPILIPILA